MLPPAATIVEMDSESGSPIQALVSRVMMLRAADKLITAPEAMMLLLVLLTTHESSFAVMVMSLPASTIASRAIYASVVSLMIVTPMAPDKPNSDLPSLAAEPRLTTKLSFFAERLTSFAAETMAPSSIYARAVPWYQVPTTVPPFELLLKPTVFSLSFFFR